MVRCQSHPDGHLEQLLCPCIDKIQYGSQQRVGFFAQEVEKVLPGAVTHLKDFIPNIFRRCSAEGNCITIVGHGLSEGVKVRIMSGEEQLESNVHVIDENTVQIDKALEKDVFVFGTEVDDFRVLNYDYLASVSFGVLNTMVPASREFCLSPFFNKY